LVVHEPEAEGGGKRKRDDETEGADKPGKRSKPSKGGDSAGNSAAGKAMTDADVIRAARRARKTAGGTDGVVEAQSEAITASETDAELARAAKKTKRRSKSTKVEAEPIRSTTIPAADEDEARAARKAKKLLKQDAKADKAARKEARHLRREAKAISQTAPEPSAPLESEPAVAFKSTEIVTQPIAPTTLSQPQSLFGGSRHAVRQRYIAQKRLASTDGRAMQEILMLKAGA
ncbi:telomerase inhibitor, partial [Oleoguttula sp. CCFEE 5521]